jgi:hypothetical protein
MAQENRMGAHPNRMIWVLLPSFFEPPTIIVAQRLYKACSRPSHDSPPFAPKPAATPSVASIGQRSNRQA